MLIVLVLGVAAATGTMLANQSFAFGLATAVIIDATIVRSVLVPSAMSLMGQRNWWSPPWLRRAHARLGIAEAGTDQAEIDLVLAEASAEAIQLTSEEVDAYIAVLERCEGGGRCGAPPRPGSGHRSFGLVGTSWPRRYEA